MYLNRKSNYEKQPCIKVNGFKGEVFAGYEDIIAELKARCRKKSFVLTVDCYPGVDDRELLEALWALDAGDDAVVYLGLKEGISKDEMISDLKKAQEGGGAAPLTQTGILTVFQLKSMTIF